MPKKADSGIWVKICPRCESRAVKPRGMISRRAFSTNYVCMACGLQGPLFPEIRLEDAKKLPDKPVNFNPSAMPVFADKFEKVSKQEERRSNAFMLVFFIVAFALLFLLLFYG